MTADYSAPSENGLIAAPPFGAGDDPAVLSDFRARIGDAGGRRVFDYYTGLVARHGLAVKEHFDPLSLPDLLPALYIEEWDAAAEQSRIKLAGEFIRDMGSGGIVGRKVDDRTEGAINALWKQCDRLNFIEQRATLALYHLDHRDLDFRWVYDLALPVTNRRGERFTIGYAWDANPDVDPQA